jgi:UPF0755 protein
MKTILSIALSVIIFYLFFTVMVKSTHFDGEKTHFEYKAQGLDQLADTLVAQKIIFEKTSFLLLAKVLKVEEKIKPGRYLVKRKTSLLDLIRMLRNNQQASVKFILNKVRTRGELAALVGKTFDLDSAYCASYFNSNDSLVEYQTDTTQLLSLFIPDTYEFYWSTSIPKFLQKMKSNADHFWSVKDRKQRAANKGMSIREIYTLASIVEEETNDESDKKLIASVYQNRLKKSMPLQACPTIKFAMQDFALTRIYEKYLSNPSPYNTYNHRGLPPGPICTPSPKTIDLVLDAPNTNYLYFVAKADFSGFHHFSSTYEEHNKYAKEYQKQLDIYQARKANQAK